MCLAFTKAGDHFEVGASLAGLKNEINVEPTPMRFIPGRFSHYAFGVIQSGLTSGIAAAIASAPLLAQDKFLANWLGAWALSWLVMLPIVIVAAPLIRAFVMHLTKSDERNCEMDRCLWLHIGPNTQNGSTIR